MCRRDAKHLRCVDCTAWCSWRWASLHHGRTRDRPAWQLKIKEHKELMAKDEEWQKFMVKFEVFLVDRNSSKEDGSHLPRYEESLETSKNREQGQSEVIGIFPYGEVHRYLQEEARGFDDDKCRVHGRL